MNKLFLKILLLAIFNTVAFAQAAVDVFIIDSYITPEKPHKLILSFFTTDKVTSELVLGGQYEYDISSDYNEDHKAEIDISELTFDSTSVEYYITGSTRDGSKYTSQKFTVLLPSEYLLTSERNTSLLSVCCFGGIIFGLPSPTLVFMDGEKYLAFSKEIPVLSFYSKGYNYPASYLSLEYSNIIEAERTNYLRVGYKHIWSMNSIEYVSGGISVFTNFFGFNGIAPEINVGLVKIYNVFTLYSRYRYNFQPDNSGRQFHEISIGLYSNFFSINF